jgi:hypothetical protein
MKTRILLFLSLFAILNLMVFPGDLGRVAGVPGTARAHGLVCRATMMMDRDSA